MTRGPPSFHRARLLSCVPHIRRFSTSSRKKRTDAQKAELREWNKSHLWFPNQIRHTVGTEVRAKYGLEAGKCYLDTRADVTQTYAERDLAKAADVARKIG